MVWYVVIAVIVGIVAAFIVGRSFMQEITYGEPAFGDFVSSLLLGIIVGVFVGGFWVFSLPTLGVVYGLWRLFLLTQKGTKRKKSNINSYGCSHPTDKTEKRTGLKALFKW